MREAHPALGEDALRCVRLASGVELHLVEQGQGEPLVFVHGVMGDWRSWAPQWPAFTPHHHCISYSRRYNHPNRNDMPSPDHSALVEAEDLDGLLDALALPSANFIASSYGALVVLALAVRRPERVRALVAVEPAMMCYAAFSAAGRAAWARFQASAVAPAQAAFRAGRDADGALAMTGGIHHHGSSALQADGLARRLQNARAMRMFALSTNEFPLLPPDALAALPMPVLLVTGENTPEVHAEVFRNVRAAMPQAQVAHVPGAGHAVPGDAPTAFNALALDFLRRAAGDPGRMSPPGSPRRPAPGC